MPPHMLPILGRQIELFIRKMPSRLRHVEQWNIEGVKAHVMPWLSASPDLNPSDHFGTDLHNRLYQANTPETLPICPVQCRKNGLGFLGLTVRLHFKTKGRLVKCVLKVKPVSNLKTSLGLRQNRKQECG